MSAVKWNAPTRRSGLVEHRGTVEGANRREAFGVRRLIAAFSERHRLRNRNPSDCSCAPAKAAMNRSHSKRWRALARSAHRDALYPTPIQGPEARRRGAASPESGGSSADFQSAVSPIWNRQCVSDPNAPDLADAVQDAILRCGKLKICATASP